jgi:hypothetical protein
MLGFMPPAVLTPAETAVMADVAVKTATDCQRVPLPKAELLRKSPHFTHNTLDNVGVSKECHVINKNPANTIEANACYLLRSTICHVALFLDVEVCSFPQTLDDQLLALCASVDVLDVICSVC